MFNAGRLRGILDSSGPTTSGLYTFGDNSNYRTGQAVDTGDTLVPTIVSHAGRRFDQLDTGTSSTVFLKNGELFGFGDNLELGIGTATGDTQTTTNLNAFSDWEYFSMGGSFGAGIRGGDLYTWGLNANGRTGQGTTSGNTLNPTQVSGFNNWQVVSAGSNYCLGIRNGELYAWGSNTSGQTGLGTTSGDQTTPSRVGSDSDWEFVAAGKQTSYGLKNGGELWGWGVNITGSSSTDSTPVRIGALDGWDSVSAGFGNGMLILDGDLYGVGTNGSQGRLGLPLTTTWTGTPLQVGASGGWQLASAGEFYSLAVQNGVLHSAGDNSFGKTGQGVDTGNTIGMTVVDGMEGIIKISASDDHSAVEAR